MNTTITVYGVDIDLASEDDCKIISYDVINGKNNTYLFYLNIVSALKAFEVIPTNNFGDKAAMGITDNVFSTQVTIKDDIVVFKVPVVGTQLKVNDFTLGTAEIGRVIIPETNREQFASMMNDMIHKEFQNYLNTMVDLKMGNLS